MKSYVSFLSILGFAAFLLSSALAGQASANEERLDWVIYKYSDGRIDVFDDGDPCVVWLFEEDPSGSYTYTVYVSSDCP